MAEDGGESLTLHAPLSGWAGDLDEVPDAVFAERMMGDGVAMDPIEGRLEAPCDGTVVLMAPTGHSVTLRAVNGAEILMHVGLETVALGGAGFTPHVANGATVRRGDLLVSFDMDLVLARAKSLMTPILLTNGDRFAFVSKVSGRLLRAGEPMAEIRSLASDMAAAAPVAAESSSVPLAVRHAARETASLRLPAGNGIHARPAARIAACAKTFAAAMVVRAHGSEANARSPLALMTLGANGRDTLELIADGADAAEAIAAMTRLLVGGLEGADPGHQARFDITVDDDRMGVCAVPGLAIGPAFLLETTDRPVTESGAGVAAERSALDAALVQVSARSMANAGDRDHMRAEVASAHLALLGDQELLDAARARIDAGKSAGFAWRDALRGYADRLRATGNPLLIERIDDLRDLERQLLAALAGDADDARIMLPMGVILMADDVLPSQLMAMDLGRLAGICTAGGGPTSHVAIMAAAAGVPMLVAAGPAATRVAAGATILLDATAARFVVEPDADTRDAAEARIAATEAVRRLDAASAATETRTADGVRIEVFANLGRVSEAAGAVAAGAEGCGLLRTEFLFLDRRTAPDLDEQLGAYQAIADALGDRPLIVRTLDIGGDKPVPYLPMPREENPALGLRGVRTSLWRPDFLDAQIEAILRVRPAGRCRIMLPMIVALAELRAVRARVDAVARGLDISVPIQLGIMIETPAAAILADQLAAEADFFSIGSNDLTQYALAMDRANPMVAAQVDSFHPAVLRLIDIAVRGAAVHGRPVGVCGGLASDPDGAVLLIGLGVTELSATPSAVPRIKARVRRTTIAESRDLAVRALQQTSAHAVRALAGEQLASNTPEGEAS